MLKTPLWKTGALGNPAASVSRGEEGGERSQPTCQFYLRRLPAQSVGGQTLVQTEVFPADLPDDEGVEGPLPLYQEVVVALQ